jgi:hypothetical protein
VRRTRSGAGGRLVRRKSDGPSRHRAQSLCWIRGRDGDGYLAAWHFSLIVCCVVTAVRGTAWLLKDCRDQTTEAAAGRGDRGGGGGTTRQGEQSARASGLATADCHEALLHEAPVGVG